MRVEVEKKLSYYLAREAKRDSMRDYWFGALRAKCDAVLALTVREGNWRYSDVPIREYLEASRIDCSCWWDDDAEEWHVCEECTKRAMAVSWAVSFRPR